MNCHDNFGARYATISGFLMLVFSQLTGIRESRPDWKAQVTEYDITIVTMQIGTVYTHDNQTDSEFLIDDAFSRSEHGFKR